jgi:penicillin-binding protein 1A
MVFRRPFSRRYSRPQPRSWPRTIALVTVLGVLSAAGVTAGVLWYAAQDVPSLESLREYQPSLVSRVYSDDRRVIGQYYVERRILTPLSQVPQHLSQAVVAVEDVRFFEHPGLDVVGILRAAWTNLRRGGKVEGASTITQQLARSLFLSPERTYLRKFKELILAHKIELILTKDEILEMYLNQIYFGQGAYGVRAAALTYFGKELSELTVAEAAFLAGLPKSPNHYSPYKNLERAKRRQEHVLGRMEDAGFLTADERAQAAAEPLSFRAPGADQIAPHFIEYVRQNLMTRYGEQMVYKGGLQVFTTLNVEMQKAAERAMRNGLRTLDKRQGWRGPLGRQPIVGLPTSLKQRDRAAPAALPKEGEIFQAVVTSVAKDHAIVVAGQVVGRLALEDMTWARRRLKSAGSVSAVTVLDKATVPQLLKPGDVIEVRLKARTGETVHFALEQTPVVEGALLALDPRNGAIRAMVGGYNFQQSEYNRAVMAHRQPGSAFKPLIYATALSQGLSPATLVVDAPVVYEDEENPEKTWKPDNYEKKFFGVMTLREALMHSRNAATIRLLERVGVRNVLDFAKTVGITSPLSYDLSLGLGSSSVTLLELTSAYGVFANQGLRVEPYTVVSVQDATDETVEQTLVEPRQVVSKEIAYLLTNMLTDVVQRGTGQLARSLGRPVAGKTGTTNDYTDAWFIGYTPNLAVGVWVGFDDMRTLGESESGAHAALPMWVEFMRDALKDLPAVPFDIPEGVVFARVDAGTGLLAADEGEPSAVEVFLKGTEPSQQAAPRSDLLEFYRLDQVQASDGVRR